MANISLIIRGDGLGVCHASNQAICEAFESGLLTCASLLTAAPWMAEAADLIHTHPEWEIGLQLSLCCRTAGCRWGPVVGAATVPSLVDVTGMFFPELPGSATGEEIARELAAQVERARSWRISPAFLEADADAPPRVRELIQRLSEQLGIPAQMETWGLKRLMLPDGAVPSENTLKLLVPGVYLWATNPAHDSPETWGLWPDSPIPRQQHAEAQALCSRALYRTLEEHGIERISFGDYVEERLGTEAGTE